MDTIPVENESEFVNFFDHDRENELGDEQAESLWQLWESVQDADNNVLLVQMAEWVSKDKLGARRPFLFAEVEYDNDNKGAVLFSETEAVNISIVENSAADQALEEDGIEISTDVDRTDTDFVDEQGLIWVPRSEMTVYERS